MKWHGAHPKQLLEAHVCPADCGQLSKDGLAHVTKAQLLKDNLKEPWMDNLVEVEKETARGADELALLRERAKKREREEGRELERTPIAAAESESSDSGEKRKKKKKKKKKKAVAEETRGRGPTKELDAVFGGTALDPKPEVRKRIRRKARKLARRKGRQDKGSSSSSGSTSGSQSSVDEAGRLFGAEVKVKTRWKPCPGA